MTLLSSRHYLRRRAAIKLLALLLALVPATATFAQDHTDLGVVTVACDWDYAPYEYINSEGEPAGFNIDVLQTILKRLGLRYEFVMNTRAQGVEAFMDHRADLIIDYRGRFDNTSYLRSRSILDYYKMDVAYKNGTSPINDPAKLNNGGTIVYNSVNDSVMITMLQQYVKSTNMVMASPREALMGLQNGQYDYFVWGHELIKWKIKEYNFKDLTSNELDIPAIEIHIAGHDEHLMQDIDNEFARLKQSGEIDRIRQHWFHPEDAIGEGSNLGLYVTLAIFIVAILAFIFYRIIVARVRTAVRNSEDAEAMMRQAFNMGSYSVIVYNMRNRHFSNVHGNSLPPEGMSLDEYLKRMHPDDNRHIYLVRQQLVDGRNTSASFNMRWNTATPDNPTWVNLSANVFIERDRNGHPEQIVAAFRNITDEVQAQRDNEELGLRYLKMFDSSVLAMSFYDKDKHLIDLNENMKKLCGFDPKESNIEYFRRQDLNDWEMLRDDYSIDQQDNFHVCQHLYIPERGIDKYIEVRLRTTTDAQGDLLYYVVTARDVTAERNMYLELRRQNMALKKTEEINRKYEEELRTLLENCNMHVWHADLNTGLITISRSLDKSQYSLSMEDYVNRMAPNDREQALNNIQQLRTLKRSFNVTHHFLSSFINGKPTWYAVSGMPLTDSEGHVDRLFGVVRNVDSLMEAQERLKQETARAENSGKLKAAFLANMTHEIRTPLNAIVGFSDLLRMVDTTEERQEFVRIIRNNCDMLLRLINDIFEASTIDLKPLEIKPKPVDFAVAFNDICQSLARRVQDPAVQFIAEQTDESLIVNIDMGRMQQVITNFVTNAVKHTRQGHIKVGWRRTPRPLSSQQGAEGELGIYMYCEDTGSGIPKDMQERIFDRFVKLNDFVQGTGLGLSICKSIAERSNGCIGVQSEGEGRGCTFWIWVPC